MSCWRFEIRNHCWYATQRNNPRVFIRRWEMGQEEKAAYRDGSRVDEVESLKMGKFSLLQSFDIWLQAIHHLLQSLFVPPPPTRNPQMSSNTMAQISFWRRKNMNVEEVLKYAAFVGEKLVMDHFQVGFCSCVAQERRGYCIKPPRPCTKETSRVEKSLN